jgi:polyphosphate kinase 2 (PPK2 family)
LQAVRLNEPDKTWKFNSDDLEDRGLWEDYQSASEVALSKTSTEAALSM